MSALLTQIIGLLTGGISEFATGLGSGLTTLVQSIFVTTGTGGEMELTTFGGLAIIFAAVSLSVGLSKFVLRWVTSFGN